MPLTASLVAQKGPLVPSSDVSFKKMSTGQASYEAGVSTTLNYSVKNISNQLFEVGFTFFFRHLGNLAERDSILPCRFLANVTSLLLKKGSFACSYPLSRQSQAG